MLNVRYPTTFEQYRLEALGASPYLAVDDARRRYDDGQRLTVVNAADPPPWVMQIAPERRRFTVTFFTGTRTPIREVTWERDGETVLCRRILDLYYPEGDPGGRLPYVQIVTVTQHVFSDGVIELHVSAPADPERFRELTSASLAALRTAIPSFGEWEPMLTHPIVDPARRFGAAATDAALADANALVPYRLPRDPGEWMTSSSGGMAIMNALHDARTAPAWTELGAPVVDRGASAIVPLVRAGRGDVGALERLGAVRDRLQMDAIHYFGGDHFHAETVLDADEGYGRVIARSGIETVGSVYAWRVGAFAAVLVHGIADRGGAQTLALHIVPHEWVWDLPGSTPTRRAQSHQRRLVRERDAADASWVWPPLPADVQNPR